MLSHPEIFIGLDLGTSGLRLVAIDANGRICASTSRHWPVQGTEQDPRQWVAALQLLWSDVFADLKGKAAALSVTSTSGTVLAIDAGGQPLGPAWLYSDRRSGSAAQRLQIPASWGLARWLWWLEQPAATATRLAHPSDFLLTALGAPAGITDHTCALKSGYDPEAGTWALALAAGVPPHQLPQVVRPGTVIGELAGLWGLGSGVRLVAGCTDGVAGQVASGALAPGEVCLSLGSTLIFKGVSRERVASPDGAVYSHLHPDGTLWLPGAASACGGAILERCFARTQWPQLNEAAIEQVPTGETAYPLLQPGERFPIADPGFAGSLPAGAPDARYFAALLEGVAFVERLGLERLAALGVETTGELLTVGGGTRSPLWLTVRASVLGRPLYVPEVAEPALGAAILAAAGAWGVPVAEAARRLLGQPERRIEPVPAWSEAYAAIYRRFCGRWGVVMPS